MARLGKLYDSASDRGLVSLERAWTEARDCGFDFLFRGNQNHNLLPLNRTDYKMS